MQALDREVVRLRLEIERLALSIKGRPPPLLGRDEGAERRATAFSKPAQPSGTTTSSPSAITNRAQGESGASTSTAIAEKAVHRLHAVARLRS